MYTESDKENYQAQQDLNRFNDLIENKEVLTQEEFDFCKKWDKVESADVLFALEVGALNLNLYSEHDHEKRS